MCKYAFFIHVYTYVYMCVYIYIWSREEELMRAEGGEGKTGGTSE